MVEKTNLYYIKDQGRIIASKNKPKSWETEFLREVKYGSSLELRMLKKYYTQSMISRNHTLN